MKNNQGVLIYIFQFLVQKSVKASFRIFMEKNRSIELQKTGHFEERYIVVEKEAKDPEFLSLGYVFILKDGEDGLAGYKENVPALEEHFLTHCHRVLDSGKLIRKDEQQKWVDGYWLFDVVT